MYFFELKQRQNTKEIPKERHFENKIAKNCFINANFVNFLIIRQHYELKKKLI